MLDDLRPETRALIAETEARVATHPDSDVFDVPDDGDYDHRCTDQELLHSQICTRLTDQEAADWFTTVRPPGTSHNRWVLADDIAPVTCEQFPATHRHVIVYC